MADKINHTHGDNGTKPPDNLNFQTGDKPDPEVFDWFWSQVPAAINDHADELDAIDSDGDGTVDSADTAAKVKGNDIDSDGDGKVDAADSADSATDATNVTSTYKGNDIDSDGDGKVDNADQADTAAKVKGNDIDSDGDGKVDSADSADSAANATNVTSTYKGNDIDSDGDGTVDSADTAAKVKGNDIDSNGDGTVDLADDVVASYSAEGHDHTETNESRIPDSALVEDYVTSANSDTYTDEKAQDAVAAALNGGTDVFITYNDAGDEITINASDTQLSTEQVEDIVGGLISGGTNTTVTYDDANDTLTIDSSDTQLSNSEVVSIVNGEVDNTATTLAGLDDTVAGISSFTDEKAQDAVGTIMSGSGATTVTYDDGANSIDVDSTDTDTHVDVIDDFNSVLTDVGTINFDSNISATVNNDRTNAVDVTATDTQLSDSEVTTIVDGEVDNAASTLAALDDAVANIDSDGDGTVNSADTAAKVKGNDIDSDGDGTVDQSEIAAAQFVL